LPIPTIVELILIAAISGIIAISVYMLYLVDKLLSRIEALEKSVNSSLAARAPRTEDQTALKRTVESVIEQINAINEVLESTGKDIDSINVKISSSIGGLATTGEKIDSIEDRVFEDKNEVLQIQREVSELVRKLEQLEKETDVIAARQQLGEEL
jgi:chromosome segregation ATPase